MHATKSCAFLSALPNGLLLPNAPSYITLDHIRTTAKKSTAMLPSDRRMPSIKWLRSGIHIYIRRNLISRYAMRTSRSYLAPVAVPAVPSNRTAGWFDISRGCNSTASVLRCNYQSIIPPCIYWIHSRLLVTAERAFRSIAKIFSEIWETINHQKSSCKYEHTLWIISRSYKKEGSTCVSKLKISSLQFL